MPSPRPLQVPDRSVAGRVPRPRRGVAAKRRRRNPPTSDTAKRVPAKTGGQTQTHHFLTKLAMSTENSHEENYDIAIVGMAGRFPGAPDLEKFWLNLRGGVESISHFTEEELLESGVPLGGIRHPDFVSAKGVLDDADMFDAAFFGISPREAELMDPQHRLLMECAWEALEDAGYDSERHDGRISVFTSTGLNTYLPFNICSHPGLAL